MVAPATRVFFRSPRFPHFEFFLAPVTHSSEFVASSITMFSASMSVWFVFPHVDHILTHEHRQPASAPAWVSTQPRSLADRAKFAELNLNRKSRSRAVR